MADYQKPLPHAGLESLLFWEYTRNHELRVQQCQSCGKLRFYPRSICPNCLSYDTEWVHVRGRGKIYSFTVSYRYPSHGFKAEVPYVIALIDLDEGVRMMSNIVGCRPEDVKIGLPVEVVFDDVTPEVTLPKFRLLTD